VLPTSGSRQNESVGRGPRFKRSCTQTGQPANYSNFQDYRGNAGLQWSRIPSVGSPHHRHQRRFIISGVGQAAVGSPQAAYAAPPGREIPLAVTSHF